MGNRKHTVIKAMTMERCVVVAGCAFVQGAQAAATKSESAGDAFGGFGWIALFVLFCYLVVFCIRRLGSSRRAWDADPQADEMVRMGTSISRPIDER